LFIRQSVPIRKTPKSISVEVEECRTVPHPATVRALTGSTPVARPADEVAGKMPTCGQIGNDPFLRRPAHPFLALNVSQHNSYCNQLLFYEIDSLHYRCRMQTI
jgi:hypothetical protein